MNNSTFSYIYYRHIPSVYFKQKVKEVHRIIKEKLVILGIENGILVSTFALGCSGRCTEIIYVKSNNKLSLRELSRIVNYILDLEISTLNSLSAVSNCNISCYGVISEAVISETSFLEYINKDFNIWSDYSVEPFNVDKIKIVENIKPNNEDLAYIGFLSTNISITGVKDLLSLKLLEEIFNSQNSILTEIRNLGICYTTISKFHEDLNIFYIGILASYSKDNENTLIKMYKKIALSKDDFDHAKDMLKRQIIFSTTLYQDEHYLLPFRIYEPLIDIPQLFDLTNEINLEEVVEIFNNRKLVCLKM